MSDDQNSLHLEMGAKLGVSLFNVPVALQFEVLYSNYDHVVFGVSLCNVPIGLQGVRLTTLGCRFSMLPLLYKVLPLQT